MLKKGSQRHPEMLKMRVITSEHPRYVQVWECPPREPQQVGCGQSRAGGSMILFNFMSIYHLEKGIREIKLDNQGSEMPPEKET